MIPQTAEVWPGQTVTDEPVPPCPASQAVISSRLGVSVRGVAVGSVQGQSLC